MTHSFRLSLWGMFRIEQYSGPEYVSCHLDLLLGRGWDVRGVGGGGGPNGEHCLGYRVILTLELRVDMKHQLRYGHFSDPVTLYYESFSDLTLMLSRVEEISFL